MKISPLPPPFEYVEKKSRKKVKVIIILSLIFLLAVVLLYVFAYKKDIITDENSDASVAKRVDELPKLNEETSDDEIKIITEEIKVSDEKNSSTDAAINNDIIPKKDEKKTTSTNENGEKEQSEENFLFESDKKLLEKKDLTNRTIEEIKLIKNEIYARHGYIFVDEELKKYFESQTWYHANEKFSPSTFNDTERKNLKIITKYLSEQ